MELVSVITPAYNAANFIAEAIESVLYQTYPNWELIIVDDGSTDKTSEIVKKYLTRDNRIKLFYQTNGKQGKARNLAISKSTGKYLAFLDADDVMLPHRLNTQVREIKLLDADLVYSNSYVFESLPLKGNEKTFNIERECYQGQEGIDSFLIRNRIPMLTVLVKKECLINVNGFSEQDEIQNAEDYHLWLKLLLKNYKFCSTSQILSAYREHHSSSSSSDRHSEFEILFVLNDLIRNNKFLPKAFKYAFLERKKKYVDLIKGANDYVYLTYSKKFLRLVKRHHFHFRMLYFMERYFNRKLSLKYLELITLKKWKGH